MIPTLKNGDLNRDGYEGNELISTVVLTFIQTRTPDLWGWQNLSPPDAAHTYEH